MAQIEIEAFQSLIKLLEATSAEAIPAAQNAAAQVYQQAARSAAPVETSGNPFGKNRNVTPKHPGQLLESVKIIQGREIKKLAMGKGQPLRRLFVGPEKKKGFYGYFLEHGWTATGPKRRERTATKNTHSQKGVSGGRRIQRPPWFEPAIKSSDSAAVSAAETAFNQKLRELDK